MRTVIFLSLISLFLAGCSPVIAVESGSGLTPFITDTAEAQQLEPVETVQVEQAPLPTQIPTPVVHIVALGDSISSIALQYGVTIDAIIAANPDIQPTVMIVGDQVVIPITNGDNTPILADALAREIDLMNPACFPHLDGLLCTVLVRNKGANNLKDVILDYELMNDAGESIAMVSAPAALRGLGPGSAIPASAFFDGVSTAADILVTVNWARYGEPAENDGPQIVLENITTTFDELYAQAAGTITAETDDAKADVTLVAVAFNDQGAVIGIRRQDSAIPSNTSVDFSISVFSSGGPITDVELYAELIERNGE